MGVPRDEFGQFKGEWGEREYRLLDILHETEEDDDRSYSVFVADILDLFLPTEED